MTMLVMQELTRTDLIGIASACNAKESYEVIEFIEKLINAGQYTEATEDEIEELDVILDSLDA